MAAVWLVAVLGAGTALAQELSPLSYDAEFDARERVRIRQEREAAKAKYDEQLADCYQRFAVNDCLRDVRRRRRVVVEALRNQEIILNDAKRAAEVQEQKQRVEERQAERERQEAERERNRSRPRGNAPASQTQ